MHNVYILPIFTILVVIGLAAWNWASIKRHQETGGKTSGLGGPNDPMM